MAHAVLYDRIKPIDDSRDDLCIPNEKATIACIGVQHEAHSRIVAFALYAIDAASFAAKAHAFGFSDTDAIGSLIGAGGKRLCHRAIDMVSDPRDTGLLGIFMQLVFREVVFFAQSRKGLCTLLFM